MTDLLAVLYSADQWHTIDDLARRLRMPRRAVENAIEHLRLEGTPIVAGNDGVRISTSAAEVREYAQDRRRRLVSIAKGTRKLLATARRMQEAEDAKGHLTLWDAA
jgi:biotin operon repressor